MLCFVLKEVSRSFSGTTMVQINSESMSWLKNSGNQYFFTLFQDNTEDPSCSVNYLEKKYNKAMEIV